VIDEDTCMVDVARALCILRARILRLVHPLREGTGWLRKCSTASIPDAAGPKIFQWSANWQRHMLGKRFCPLGDAPPWPHDQYCKKWAHRSSSHLSGQVTPISRSLLAMAR